MSTDLGNNYKSRSIALKNLLVDLLRKFPIIFVVFMWMVGYALLLFTRSKNKMEFGLCFVISIVSILMYSQTKKYAETMFPFMIGILTIFTINWNSTNSIIFITFYIGINIVFFFLTAISIGSKVETELTSATSYLDQLNFKSVYKELNIICKKGTKYNQLDAVSTAETIKYLAYARIPINEMHQAIVNIEMIKVVYGLTLKEACDFYRDIYFVSLRSKNGMNVSLFLEIIFVRALPVTPSEFINIFDRTKKILISGSLDIEKYLDNIEGLLYKGHSNEDIVLIMNA